MRTSLISDSTGAALPNSSVIYAPFGEIRQGVQSGLTDFGYTGQRLDGSTGGLMHYEARYYLPGLRRFISADSVIPGAGNSQALNRYSYVYNNPLKYVDPSGHVGITNCVEGVLCGDRRSMEDICRFRDCTPRGNGGTGSNNGGDADGSGGGNDLELGGGNSGGAGGASFGGNDLGGGGNDLESGGGNSGGAGGASFGGNDLIFSSYWAFQGGLGPALPRWQRGTSFVSRWAQHLATLASAVGAAAEVASTAVGCAKGAGLGCLAGFVGGVQFHRQYTNNIESFFSNVSLAATLANDVVSGNSRVDFYRSGHVDIVVGEPSTTAAALAFVGGRAREGFFDTTIDLIGSAYTEGVFTGIYHPGITSPIPGTADLIAYDVRGQDISIPGTIMRIQLGDVNGPPNIPDEFNNWD